MSAKLMSYILESIINDEISKASLLIENDTAERPKKIRKRSNYFVINDETESITDEDILVKDLTKYIVEQVNIMKELLPGRTAIEILNRIKQMEIARDVEQSDSSASEISNTLVLDDEF
jgi:hypothetical protein